MTEITLKDKQKFSNNDKEVYLFRFSRESIEYAPGDVLKIYPKNDQNILNKLAKFIELDEEINDFDLHPTKAMLSKYNDPEIQNLLSPINFLTLNKFISMNNIVDVFEKYGAISLADLKETLNKIRPRSYSIASSMLYTDEIEILMALTKFVLNDKEVKGFASSFAIERVNIGDKVKVEHRAHPNFKLPQDDKDVIMICAGTGLAPFIGFLQERLCKNAIGRNWLFFGERKREDHFYYEDFLLDLEKRDFLKLSLAFSRDQDEKVYVQDIMESEREALKEAIEKGAYIYLCGDAKVMAKAVEEKLQDILKNNLNLLIQEKRYFKDVY